MGGRRFAEVNDMSILILINGDLAVGKSFFAERLAAETKIPAVTKDRLKELICDAVGYKTREENYRFSVAVASLFFHLAEQNLKVGGDLILESNFRQYELDELARIARAHGARLVTFVLEGDLHVLHERFLGRIAGGNRHAAHLSQDLSRFEDFAKLLLDNRERTYSGEVYRFDNTVFDDGLPARAAALLKN